ncbi:MAG: hypothetical protein JW822_08540 [Spirochaetales bacterium]|nr:hypothetical protein [Spirochaetales bacterium]
MDKIKSAWEIALEKTKNVKADRESLKEREYLEQGKKIISAHLDNPKQGDVNSSLKKIAKNYQGLAKKGMVETLLSNLTLPLTDFTSQRNTLVQQTFSLLFPDSQEVAAIFAQLEQFFNRFAEDRKSIQEQIKTQYMPKLQQKAEAIARQLGTEVELDPFADPEFNAILKKSLAQFDERYNAVLRQAKDELQRLI